MSLETINLFGTQQLLKKQSFACISFIKDNQKGVIITGGINSLRNESKETVHINIEKNKAEIFSPLSLLVPLIILILLIFINMLLVMKLLILQMNSKLLDLI